MYNLQKAKQEIDAVATHTADLTAHVIAMDDRLQARLDQLKTDLLEIMGAKFAELETAILGSDQANFETSAVADLGAKVASLIHGSPVSHSAPHEPAPHESAPHESAPHELGASHPIGPSHPADVPHDDHGQHGDADHHHD